MSNKNLFQAIAARLRKRTAQTWFQWVKGHEKSEGIIQADKLAGEGAGKNAPDAIDTSIDTSMVLAGACLAKLTQAIAYKGITSFPDACECLR